jgi:hypothetical protein
MNPSAFRGQSSSRRRQEETTANLRAERFWRLGLTSPEQTDVNDQGKMEVDGILGGDWDGFD